MRSFKAYNHLLKLLPKNRVNPILRIEAAAEVVGNYFLGREGELKAGRHSFSVAKAAVLVLLHEARILCRFGFWAHLNVPSNFRWERVPEPFIDSLKKQLYERDEQLRAPDVTRADLIDAMNLVTDAFRSMHQMFMVGHVRVEIPDAQQYRCAALLPAVTALLDDVWVPLRSIVRQQESKHGSAPGNPDSVAQNKIRGMGTAG